MRYLYNLIILLLISGSCFSQNSEFPYSYKDGYRFLTKAEKKIEEGDYNKAEKLLAKAMKADYGFCGNAWYGAHGRIHLMQVTIHRERKEYDKALSILDLVDGCQFGVDCTQRDLVRVEILIEKFGKDKVRDAFTGVVTKIIGEDYFDAKYSVELPSLDYSFSFPFNYEYETVDGKQVHKEPDMVQLLKSQAFYALLE